MVRELTVSPLQRPGLLLNWYHVLPHLAFLLYMHVVVSVAVIVIFNIIGALIVFAAEDSSHSLAKSWRAGVRAQ